MELLEISKDLCQISKQLALLQNFICIKLGCNWDLDFKTFCESRYNPPGYSYHDTLYQEDIRNSKRRHATSSNLDDDDNHTRISSQSPAQGSQIQPNSSINFQIIESLQQQNDNDNSDYIDRAHPHQEDTRPLDNVGIVTIQDIKQEFIGFEEAEVEDVESFPHFTERSVVDPLLITTAAPPNNNKTYHPYPSQFVKPNPNQQNERKKRRLTANSRFKCPKCQTAFCNQAVLTRHLKNRQACIKIWECPFCDKVYHKKSFLISHIRYHNNKSSSQRQSHNHNSNREKGSGQNHPHNINNLNQDVKPLDYNCTRSNSS